MTSDAQNLLPDEKLKACPLCGAHLRLAADPRLAGMLEHPGGLPICPIAACFFIDTPEMRAAWNRRSDSAVERVEGWQPIETAPRNGREILITTAGVGMLVRVGFFDEGLDGVWSIWPGRQQMQPTHWRPLPTPPDLRPNHEVK